MFYLDLADNDEGLASTLVTNKMVKCWGNPTTDELITVAKANTEVKYTATVNRMPSFCALKPLDEKAKAIKVELKRVDDNLRNINFENVPDDLIGVLK